MFGKSFKYGLIASDVVFFEEFCNLNMMKNDHESEGTLTLILVKFVIYDTLRII